MQVRYTGVHGDIDRLTRTKFAAALAVVELGAAVAGGIVAVVAAAEVEVTAADGATPPVEPAIAAAVAVARATPAAGAGIPPTIRIRHESILSNT